MIHTWYIKKKLNIFLVSTAVQSPQHCLAHLCCVLWYFWQRWSLGSPSSRRRARWITHSWPSTPARTNWSSEPGNPYVTFIFLSSVSCLELPFHSCITQQEIVSIAVVWCHHGLFYSLKSSDGRRQPLSGETPNFGQSDFFVDVWFLFTLHRPDDRTCK